MVQDAGLNRAEREFETLLAETPFNAKGRRRFDADRIEVGALPLPPIKGAMSTQQGFGQILAEIARAGGKLAEHIVTTSPDVTVSTNLGPLGQPARRVRDAGQEDVFQARKLMSAQRWGKGQSGQHIELGIAENNLFLMLAAMGLSHSIFGERLLPIGTLYDPFIARGFDALELCLLPGCALHPGGDAVGHHAGAGGRRAPVDRHAADRHGAGRHRQLRAVLCRRARR